GINLNWSNPANWVGGAPQVGEPGPVILNFPPVAANLKATVNDLTGGPLAIDQINFTDTGYSLGPTAGISITLTGATTPAITDTVGPNFFFMPITLASNVTVQIAAGSGSATEFGNLLSGPGGVNKTGAGRLQFFSPVRNTYGGATLVSAGTLELANVGPLPMI